VINGRIEAIFGDEIVLVEEKADCVEVSLKHGGKRRLHELADRRSFAIDDVDRQP